MPEGDTIHRSAWSLRSVLEGRTVERFEATRLVRHRTLIGQTVASVDAEGKHLFVRFGDGRALHTHMRMTGSWHVYRTGERWRKPPWQARVVLGVEGIVAVCFNAPVVELLDPAAEGRHPSITRLGPDLCRSDADLDEAVRRMAAHEGEEIGSVLLDQTVACGIGNIYKSETLFSCGIDPFTPVEKLAPETRRRLFETASRLLRQNLRGSVKRKFDGVPGAVYQRHGRPCRRCGVPIEVRRQGAEARATYWCPQCQS